jgi:arsenate reductase
MPDPAAVEGSEEERLDAFRAAARVLHRRLELLASLPIESLDRPRLEAEIRRLGESSAGLG